VSCPTTRRKFGYRNIPYHCRHGHNRITIPLLPKEAAMNPIRSRPRSLALLTALAVTVLALVAPTAAGASTTAAPSCSTHWGSQAKGGAPTPAPSATVAGVRAGRHACYDRLVIDVAGPRTFGAWTVRYVPVVKADPSDRVVPLRGGAFLQITLGASGTLTTPGRPLVGVTGFSTFRQVKGAGAFEGVSTIGLGVRARLPFRVFTLSGPAAGETRLVVDVAHGW
jgi:hypothetical protein